MHHDNDSQPLLSGHNDPAEEHIEDRHLRENAKNPQRMWWRPLVLVFLLTLVSDIGYFVSIAPQTRLFESLICRKYYSERGEPFFLNGPAKHPGEDEGYCKIPAVQDVVAELFGMQIFFDGIVGVLLGIYYGALADRIGRRAILTLSTMGSLLSSSWTLFICWIELPLRLVWLSSVFLLVGGGSTVTNAVLSMVLTDATPPPLRSRVFLYFTAASLGSEILSPLVASYFMHENLWIPLTIGLVCTMLTVLIACMVPETLPPGCKKDEASKIASEDGSTLASENVWPAAAEAAPITRRRPFDHAVKTLKYIASSRGLLVLVCTFLVSDFARQSLQVLLQYVSLRYDITLAKANYLLSWRAAAALVHNTVILPLVDQLLEKKMSLPAQVKDLLLARGSIIFLTLGFAALVVAPALWFVVLGLFLYTLGSAFNVFCRSLISNMTEPQRLGTIYSTLATMDTIGSLLAGPIMANGLKLSVRLHGIWQGMPYIFSFVLCGLTAVMIVRIRPHALVIEGASEEREAFLRRGTPDHEAERDTP